MMPGTAIVPFASVSLHDASLVYSCLSELSSIGCRQAIVQCGSGRCRDAFFEYAASVRGKENLGIRCSVEIARSTCGNGVTAVGHLLLSSVEHPYLSGERTALLCPPWWSKNRDYRELDCFSLADNDDVVSVMLSGWYWAFCGGKMNYVPRDCRYEGCHAVRSWYRCENHVFNADAPQIVNLRHFRHGGILEDLGEYNGVLRHVRSSYWGRDDINMVLVPKDVKPMFDDVLGMDPGYRSEPC
jgi:hypothetical protein